MREITLRRGRTGMVYGFALSLMLFLWVSCGHRPSVIEQSLCQGWTLTGDTLNIKELPVSVPSVVQQSLYEAGRISHPYEGTVENDLLWISDHPWIYTTHFDVGKTMLDKEVVELMLEGIDTYAEVRLNGQMLIEVDNQFRTWKTDVKTLLKEKNNLLEVSFIRYDSTQLARYEQHHPQLPEKYAVTRKCGYQHGWDWAPKYKNVGLWKPVKLVAWSGAKMENAYIVTNEATETQAQLTLHLDVENTQGGEMVAEIRNQGKTMRRFPFQIEKGNQHKMFSFSLENPRLWWPNEMGEQALYDFEVVLKEDDKILDSKMIRTGIKTLQMVQEPDEKGFSFFFKVNGMPLYAKGANYIPEQMVETWIHHDQTLSLLLDAQKAHFNMLRVWGGGIYPSDDFFNSCDSLGILVWEDFMYAGSMYPYDRAFLNNAKEEALEQVKRLASHPSLGLWCGGNEISEGYYNWGWQQSLGWSEDDDQAIKAGYDRLFEEILPFVVDTYDGTRSYWPSSPSKGWGRPESLTQGDVHYWGVWWGELPFEAYREKVGRFNSEYGYQAYPDLNTLKKAAGDDVAFKALCEYQAPEEGENRLYELISNNHFLAAHQKHVRGTQQINDFIERYYPTPTNFAEYVTMSQLSQAFGVGMAIEAHRNAMPYNMGTLYWQLNDAWPVTSWSTIDFYGNKKALQYQLQTLYAPVLLSLDAKDRSVWVASDRQGALNGKLKVMVKDFHGEVLFEQDVKLQEDRLCCAAKKYYVEGLNECLALQDPGAVYVKLELVEESTLVAERCCYLVYPKDLKLPEAKVEITQREENGIKMLELRSEVLAKDVCLHDPSGESVFSDNYFDLEPNVPKRIPYSGPTPTLWSLNSLTSHL